MFANCSKLYNAGQLFIGCKSLTGEVPEELFSNCPELLRIDSLFRDCVKITGEIPINFVINNDKLQNLGYAFYGCTGITDSELKITSMHILQTGGYSKTFEGINADISIYIPKGSYKPINQYLSTTANVTVVEYDVE